MEHIDSSIHSAFRIQILKPKGNWPLTSHPISGLVHLSLASMHNNRSALLHKPLPAMHSTPCSNTHHVFRRKPRFVQRKYMQPTKA